MTEKKIGGDPIPIIGLLFQNNGLKDKILFHNFNYLIFKKINKNDYLLIKIKILIKIRIIIY